MDRLMIQEQQLVCLLPVDVCRRRFVRGEERSRISFGGDSFVRVFFLLLARDFSRLYLVRSIFFIFLLACCCWGLAIDIIIIMRRHGYLTSPKLCAGFV